jgi:hypothetical protein
MKNNPLFILFKKCDCCEEVRHISLFDNDNTFYKTTTCKLCEQKQFNDAMSAMNDYYNDYYAEEAKRQSKNYKDIFSELAGMVCEDFIKDINDCIEDCEGGFDFKIVDLPCGDRQVENYEFIKHIYVDQSYGYCGDDYYGEIYIPLLDNKYLQFSFQC